MSNLVKDHDHLIKNVGGVAQALKIEADSTEFGPGHNDLYLSLNVGEQEKLFPFQYKEEKNDYRVLQIPLSFSEEDIKNGEVVQVQVQD
ncbi:MULTISPECIES: hypothetical protein [Pontibacillus]|uniref:Uncharacterized protein n=1 Tax=Pontibacillus chungwhensis TaxID=265426 RepID=A0ABY8UVX7_9BACI|nr:MULTISPECIES: hypothetical protein [Pontibacillus]MCD5324113.1 hypothetical protein [Pontibacillus sp. HN14]WIF97830.1 hypothetical protein QNI29_19215 [Pontibacillus chungwhensis]